MLQHLRDSLCSYPCRWLLNWSPFVHAAARHSCCIVPKLSWVHGHQFHETMGATPSFSVYVHNQGTVLACLRYLRFLAQLSANEKNPQYATKNQKANSFVISKAFSSLLQSPIHAPMLRTVQYNVRICTVQYHVCIVQCSIMYVSWSVLYVMYLVYHSFIL